MAIYDTTRTSGDTPFVYIIGDRMQLDQLQQYAGQLNTQTNDTITIHLLDAAGQAGAEVCEQFDIEEEQLPAVLLCEADESVYQEWYGETIPEVGQLIYTIQQITGATS